MAEMKARWTVREDIGGSKSLVMLSNFILIIENKVNES